jgi:cellulose synthase/poly-beta-1,6-N-acetylglucosamine synthase-like glycosyltransferase
MKALFFSLLFLSIYPYSIYPLVVYIMSRFFNNSWGKGDIAPQVSIIISVYNEERVIEEKVKNTLSLDYPEELLEILVISDGSTDRTNGIVSGFKDSGIVLWAFQERTGKTACLNRIVPKAKGDIVLFTDANSIFLSDVIPKLVRNFSDQQVGLVTGWTKYIRKEGGEETTGIYSRLEMLTKYRESLISSCIGADGAIFAMRKALYEPLGEQDINDFVVPLHVILQGKRVVLDPEVYCIEESPKEEGDEFRRQARITNRTLSAIWRNAGFLNPFFHGYFSFFLLSHKLLRFLVPFFVTGAFIANLFLLRVSLLYVGFILIQILFLGLGLANIAGKIEGRLTNICKFFLITLYAQAIGWIRMVRGIPDTMWTPQR